MERQRINISFKSERAARRRKAMFNIFIGSSGTFYPIAEELKKIIEDQCNATTDFIQVITWKDDIFKVTGTTVESLDSRIGNFHAGIFIFAPDDIVYRNSITPIPANSKPTYVPRDNVILEYGMFFGRLYRKNAIPVVCSNERYTVQLPSDIQNITQILFNFDIENGIPCLRKDDMFTVGVKDLCKTIKEACQPITGVEKIYQNFDFRQADKNELHRIADVARFAYGDTSINPADKKISWWEKNRNCFWVVMDKNNIRANISIIPLTQDCYQKLRNGQILESEITADDIVTKKSKVTNLYIEGLCNAFPLEDDGHHQLPTNKCECTHNRREFVYLMENIWEMIDSLADSGKVENICALKGSDAGGKLLTNLGFTVISRQESRKDKLDFYNATPEKVFEFLQKKLNKIAKLKSLF